MLLKSVILLLSPDILNRICSHVVVPHKVLQGICVQDRKTLARLARTCRLFHRLAISTLWHTLKTWLPVFCVLPSDLCKLEWDAGSFGSTASVREFKGVRLLRTPKPEDFERLMLHTPHVHTFFLEAMTGLRKPIDIQNYINTLGVLFRHFPKPLFPLLRHFNHGDAEDQRRGHDTMLLLLAPHVIDARINIVDLHRNLELHLHRLTAFCPELERLDISLDHPGTEHNPKASIVPGVSGLGTLVHLRSLNIPTISMSPSALALFGTLPCLASIFFFMSFPDCGSTWHAFFANFDEKAQIFPALEEVMLITNELGSAVSFLALVSSSRISFLSIDEDAQLENRAYSPPIATLFTTIGCHPSRLALRNLTVTSQRGHPRIASCDFTTELPKLFAISGLVEVTLSGLGAVSIDDVTLDALSLAWPALELLDLNSTYAGTYFYPNTPAATDPAPPTARPTLSGLIALAQRCPSLHSLSIPLNARPTRTHAPSSSARSLSDPRSDCALHVLNVGPESTLEAGDTVRTARFLATLFPQLKHVSFLALGLYANESLGAMRWHEVGKVIAALRVVQRQERAWAAKAGQLARRE